MIGVDPFLAKRGTIHINLAHAFSSYPPTLPHPSASHGNHGSIPSDRSTSILVAEGTHGCRRGSPGEYRILRRVPFVLIHHDAFYGRVVFDVFCPEIAPIVCARDIIDGSQNALIFNGNAICLFECMVLLDSKK